MGKEYAGTMTNDCQAWASQTPNQHNFTNIYDFPDASVEAAGAFCRNPRGSGVSVPWCYSSSLEGVVNHCGTIIPSCGKSLS